jgi:mannose-6-phosphate isomerase-like protein (cupin superfamily)
VDGVVNHLTPGQLIHIEPGEIHYVRNPYDKPVKMISTLAPFTDPDKIDVENYTW